MAETVSSLDNPQLANELTQAVFADASLSAFPEIPEPSDTSVALQVGLSLPSGDLLKEATVRELTGKHEEDLARAMKSGSTSKYMETLLVCGTEKIGEKKATPDYLRRLVMGDRTALLLGIRRVTFGDEIELPKFICANCQQELDISLTLGDIPVVTFDELKEKHTWNEELEGFELKLPRSKRTAVIRLMTGEDQAKVLQDPKWTIAEQNTVILSRIIVAYVDHDSGEIGPTDGSSGHVLNMNIKDRRALLDFMEEIQVGPRLDLIKFTHETCGEEMELPLSVDILFQEL